MFRTEWTLAKTEPNRSINQILLVESTVCYYNRLRKKTDK